MQGLTAKKIAKIAKPILRPYQVQYLGLFGSVARGTASKKSDIDLLVKMKKVPGLVGLIRLEENLGRAFGKKVDLVFKDSVTPRLKPYIEQDLITLYENR